MNAAIARLKNSFRPIEHSSMELLVMRVLLALIVWRAVPGAISTPEQPLPVGLTRWFGIPFTFLSDPDTYAIIRNVLRIALIVFVSGRALFIVLPILLFGLVGIGTLNNSQGAQTHSTQVLALCLLALAGWHLYARFTRKNQVPSKGGHRLWEGQRGIWYAQQAVAASYIVSALTKWLARGDWIGDSHHFPIQVVKSQRMDYFNTLEKASEQGGSYGWISDALRPLAQWLESTMMSAPQWAPLLLAPGFLLELFAVLLLGGRKMGAFYALALVLFHLTIAEMMGLNFKFNIFLLIVLFSGIAFWLAKPLQFFLAKLAPQQKSD